MQVSKWGNSLALRLPAAVVDALDLKEGDHITVEVLGRREFAVARKAGKTEWLERLQHFRGRLPADWRFDRDDVNAR